MEHATVIGIDDRGEPRSKPLTRHEDDPHAWAFEQAALLKAGRLADLDILNLADEIEDVGRHEYDKLESTLAIVIGHLLTWDFQEGRRSRSWVDSIREHRKGAIRQLRKAPSLRGRQSEVLEDAYERGEGDALIETGLPESTLPSECPYAWDEIMTRAVEWPAAAQ